MCARVLDANSFVIISLYVSEFNMLQLPEKFFWNINLLYTLILLMYLTIRKHLELYLKSVF